MCGGPYPDSSKEQSVCTSLSVVGDKQGCPQKECHKRLDACTLTHFKMCLSSLRRRVSKFVYADKIDLLDPASP